MLCTGFRLSYEMVTWRNPHQHETRVGTAVMTFESKTDFWLFPMGQRANSLLLPYSTWGIPSTSNFKTQHFKLQNTLWVGKGKRHLPNTLDFLPLWTRAALTANAVLWALGGRTQELKAMALFLFRQTCSKLSFTSNRDVVRGIFIYFPSYQFPYPS